ncbi:DUF6348 family protein [Hymenobacter guriensis]|uniref:Uncharacterized protein n=1 Tax=Hymenobacter guriensis TaxID=2793065 RepID=A0ABS0KY08_9BACT|nr:DUF6348 family protein [Hymenobacter guriensis]MBG8552238.1 hypothetical protein [Hymenobacter guriensis]
MAEINFQLQNLFVQHDIRVIPLENKALLMTKQPALIQSRVTQQQHPNGATSRLDVQITLGNRTIIECFGDIGETLEAATQNNLRNFAHNSLHVLINALQDKDEDEQISIERWQIGTQRWKVYSGNYGIKSTVGKSVPIPENLYVRIESIIQSLSLKEDYHWFRFFISCSNKQISNIEFLVDNEVYPEAQQELATLDWYITPDFYSIRLFMILQREAHI